MELCVTFHSKTAETKVVVALKVHFESRAITRNGAKKKIKVAFWNGILPFLVNVKKKGQALIFRSCYACK